MYNSSEVLSINHFFKEQFIVVSSEWIEACISFVKEEHGQNLPIPRLKNFVYQQWLSADLEEIGVCVFGSICKNLLSMQKTTLTGHFALQVDGIRDVGRPAYSQLKELQQDVNSNAEFSAAPLDTQAPWEAKPTRMLMLNLTDGCSHIQGMEYRSINCLSPNLPPGIKVLVQGPIDCRFGVLLLTSENIKVLGGEVEDKLDRFSRKAILREILQIPPEEDTDVPSGTINSEEPMHTSEPLQDPFSNNACHQRPQNETNPSNMRQATSSFQNTDRRESFRQNNLGLQQNSGFGSRASASNESSVSHIQRTTQSRTQKQIQDRSVGLDDFENDDDFDLGVDPDVLDELEKESLNKSKSFEAAEEDPDIWLEDPDVVQDMMAFQDENPGFEMPMMYPEEMQQIQPKSSKIDLNKPFTYLASVEKESSDITVTIKGFIITVLSKLGCTDKGWNLMVKINDGTATLDVDMHDQVLEGIIGISAVEMAKMQGQAVGNPEKGKEIARAVSRFKSSLQELNCLMDIKFKPGSVPCLVKCYPVSHSHAQQLLKRVQSRS